MIIDRDALLRRFVAMQYVRNDMAFTRGTFRVRGDTIEIIPVYEELAIRIEMFGDEIDSLAVLHPLTGDVINQVDHTYLFPASHYVAGEERMKKAIASIEEELDDRLAWFRGQNKLSRSNACGCAPPSTWRCSKKSVRARAWRTTRATSTGEAPARPRTRSWTTFPTTSCSSSTNRT